MRLRSIIKDIGYIDERITWLEFQKADLVLIPVFPHTIHRAAELSVFFRHHDVPVLFFGLMPTIAPAYCLRFCDSVAIGDITSSLGNITSDLTGGGLRKEYHPENPITFDVERDIEQLPGFVPDYSQLRLLFGCGCADLKEYCPNNYLYPEPRLCDLGKAINLVAKIKRKRILLLDDGVDSNPEYYRRFFQECWSFHKEWIVSATGRIFSHPELLLAMKRAGVRIITLKGDYYLNRKDREINKDLAYIHHLRMIPGLTITLTPDQEPPTIDSVMKLSADFAVFPTLTPIPFTKNFNKKTLELDDLDFFDLGHPVLKGVDPNLVEGIKDRYYSLDQVWIRLTSSISRIGVYNAFYYLLPINLGLRQNFLEGIPYPP